MSKTIKEEHLRKVLPIVRKKIKLADAAKVCSYGKRSIERWIAYKHGGEAALDPKSTAPKIHRSETPIWVKERVIVAWTTTKKRTLKLHWQMKKEGLLVPVRAIGNILKRKGLVWTYRVKRVKYKYIFLETVVRRAPFSIQAIKTDNHATFTNYYAGTNKQSDLQVKSLYVLDHVCRERGIKHYCFRQ